MKKLETSCHTWYIIRTPQTKIHAKFIDWNSGTGNRMNCRDIPLKMEWWDISWNGMWRHRIECLVVSWNRMRPCKPCQWVIMHNIIALELVHLNGMQLLLMVYLSPVLLWQVQMSGVKKICCADWVIVTLTCLRGTLSVIVDIATNICDFPNVIGLIVSCENAYL